MRYGRNTPRGGSADGYGGFGSRAVGPRGFTLIELLIVILILGIMAGITVPQFTNSSRTAREAALASMAHTLRGQVAIYKLQHGDQLPDLAAASGAGNHFEPLATVTTYGTPPQNRGPYLQGVPVNPITGGSVVLNATTFNAAGQPNPVPGADFIYDYGPGGTGSGNVWGTTDRATGSPLLEN